jgi:hypothetical protein
MESFLESGVVPPSLATAPARVPLAQVRVSMSLADRIALNRADRVKQLRVREAKITARRPSSRPQIFTAEFVESLGPVAIAKLLDDCWYDLARAEGRRR